MINGKQKIKKDDWGTPNYLYDQLNARFNFTLDVACTTNNCKSPYGLYYDKGIDGLKESWCGERVFCNPPFSEKDKWIRKACKEITQGDCPLVVMILPNCIDTRAFNDCIYNQFKWEHLPYRVSFLDEEGKAVPGNPSGTIIVYFWKNIKRK
jgi:site-specific DNA-methyltransferase (adenine-specific)